MNLKRTSKFLSLVLRHKPEAIGLTLDAKGRANIDTLLELMNKKGHSITREFLNEVVETNDKKRFTIDGDYIFANQGHTIKNVDVEIEEKEPPRILYHGTGEKSVNSILKGGINSRQRNHVHLSKEFQTAMKVGSRHGNPVVFRINSKLMYNEGIKFYISKNNVWLTKYVDKKYINLHK